MRPTIRFLSNSLIQKIIDEARQVLCELGVEVHNTEVLGMLASHGAEIDSNKSRVMINEGLIDRA